MKKVIKYRLDFAEWWPTFLGVGFLAVVLVGSILRFTPIDAIDRCNAIIANCEMINEAKVLGDIDKHESIATKPTLGNYRTFNYEVISWGSVTVSIDEFSQLSSQTLNDPRGWSQGGLSFNKVATGGDFSLVISEASVLDTLPGCSSQWSCRSGRYVVINQERWAGATTAWNEAGGSLRDYRHMVVNHEVGHWLGLGHSYCSGAGNLAFVMQQQSITLGGCKFNPWPLLSEINALQ